MRKEGTLDAVASGEELNTGEVTEPRQAATVIVLRGGDLRAQRGDADAEDEQLERRQRPAHHRLGGGG